MSKIDHETMNIVGVYPANIEDGEPGIVCVKWAVENCGYGEITFRVKDGKVCCDNEYMSREFMKKILCHLVDISILDSDKKEEKNESSND
tara:strand:+ start:50818 stop:51087 length:270 start_codon:yes stop_codon:yes gene_type:complete